MFALRDLFEFGQTGAKSGQIRSSDAELGKTISEHR